MISADPTILDFGAIEIGEGTKAETEQKQKEWRTTSTLFFLQIFGTHTNIKPSAAWCIDFPSFLAQKLELPANDHFSEIRIWFICFLAH